MCEEVLRRVKTMRTPKKRAARTTVSMPQEMFERAQRRVRGTFPTFSAYVQQLVRADLSRPKVDEGL